MSEGERLTETSLPKHVIKDARRESQFDIGPDSGDRGVAQPNDKSVSAKEPCENRIAILSLKPHLKTGKHVGFEFLLGKSRIEMQTGTKLELGKVYELVGMIEGLFRFQAHRVCTKSRRLRINVPREYHHRIRLGEKYKITLFSIKSRTTSMDSRDLLDDGKVGRKWRFTIGRIHGYSDVPVQETCCSGTSASIPKTRKPPNLRLHEWTGGSNSVWRHYLGEFLEAVIARKRSQSMLGFSVEVDENSRPKVSNKVEVRTHLGHTTFEGTRVLSSSNAPVHLSRKMGGSREVSASLLPAKSTETRKEMAASERRPLTWDWVAGFFEGEGSICIHIFQNTINFEILIAQKWQPLLDSIASFLKEQGVHNLSVRQTHPTGMHGLSICSMGDVRYFLNRVLPYLRLKERQARATVDYLDDKITGSDVVRIMNEEVEAGKRKSEVVKVPDQPLTHIESVRRFRSSALKIMKMAMYQPLQRLDNIPEV